MRSIRVGSRRSPLARLQSYLVVEEIKKYFKNINFEFFSKDTIGDKDLQSPLWKMTSKGVFTQDFRQDLLDKKIDFVVHSWKDVEIEEESGTTYKSVLHREDQRDILFLKKDTLSNYEQIDKIYIFSSSPRRIYNIPPFLKKAFPVRLQNIPIEFQPVRGNIKTRFSKWLESKNHGIIFAKAAIDRLLSYDLPYSKEEYSDIKKYIQASIEKSVFMCLPLSENPSLPAQGGLVVEYLKENKEIAAFIEKINQPLVQSLVDQERKILKNYGGGCHQKIGVSCISTKFGNISYIRGKSDTIGEIQEVKHHFNRSFPKPLNLKDCWPLSTEDGLKFKRTDIEQSIPNKDIWVSRSNAWLPNWKQENYQNIVWAAGTKTWFDLAKKDIWVSGCSDSLGENEPHNLEKLRNHKIDFIKITHTKSKNIQSQFEKFCTYSLELEKDIPSDLAQKTHFYWMSAYQFDLVSQKYPEILNKYHFCGFGITYEHLLKKLNNEKNLFPCLNYYKWQETIRSLI